MIQSSANGGRQMSVDGLTEHTTPEITPGDWQSVIIDVSDLPLADLLARSADEDSALAGSLRRVAADLAEPGRPIAGFNSAI